MSAEAESESYPSRQWTDGWPKKYIETLLDQLAQLQRETKPGGADTDAAKDLKAFQALTFAGKLVHAVAGWALDHQCGLALQGLQFVPLQPSDTKDYPEYLEQRARVDSHDHEREGGVTARKSTIDPLVARKLLYNLVLANPGAFPSCLQHLTLEALRALDYGETTPLLRAEGKNAKRGYRELSLQLQALGFVEYRVGLGQKKFSAQEVVGQAYGVSNDTLRTWGKRLRDAFGQLEVARTLAFARNAALQVKAIKLDWHRGQGSISGISLAEMIDSFEMRYGDEAFMDAARRYKRLQGFSAS